MPLIARLETLSGPLPSLRIVTLLAALAAPPCTSLKSSRAGLVAITGVPVPWTGARA